jgi:hypothetical protein
MLYCYLLGSSLTFSWNWIPNPRNRLARVRLAPDVPAHNEQTMDPTEIVSRLVLGGCPATPPTLSERKWQMGNCRCTSLGCSRCLPIQHNS